MMLSLGVAIVMSCSSDDDATDSQASIVGTWKESKTVIYNGSNNAVLDTELPDECDKKNSYEFTSAGQLNTTIYYTQSGGVCAIDGTDSEAYTYNSETKKIVVNGETTDVLSLTSNELQIVVDLNDENGDGIDDKVVMFLYK